MRGFPGLTLVAVVFATVVAAVAQAEPGAPAAATPPPAAAAAVDTAGPQPYAPPPPPPAYPAPYPAPYATRPPAYPAPAPFGYSPWALYEEIRKSPGLAFLLEFLLPGAGSIYADHTVGAIITWGLALGGMLVIINSGRTTRDPYTGDDQTELNDTQLAVGVLMLLGGRTYGLIDSVVSTRAYNERLRQRLGLGAALGLNALPVATGGHVLVPSLRFSF